MAIDEKMRARAGQVLRDVFGFPSFLPDQEEVVEAILAREDAIAVMPTGGGKSLCYQLPAHLMEGVCLVVSPLISLMKDQVDAAVATGLRASFLNSSLSVPMKRRVESQLAAGELDLLYISPERFAMPEFQTTLKRADLSFVAIDEAHCISEWGHDFRPDYLNLSTVLEGFPGVPVTAFTATATKRVQDDVIAKLRLRSPHIVRASFNRPNLFYKVVSKEKPGDQILRFVQSHAGEPGIIYRTARRSVEQTATMLTKHGIRALPYHAGLEAAARIENQDAFNRDEVDVIVATIAFGMGIDKSNVRYILHGDLPRNLESYYQETGRGGRDGEPAHCLLLFGYGDIPKIRFFIDQVEDEAERTRSARCLTQMVNYAAVYACRRKQLLNYFGEDYTSGGHRGEGECCDVCSGEVESIDATEDAQIIMSAMTRTGQRFGINHILAVVTGEDTDRIRRLAHDRIKTFGAGRDRDKGHWRSIIGNLLAQGLIRQTAGDYPILQLQPEAEEVLFGGRRVHVLKTRKATTRRPRKSPATAGPYNEDLFDQLRALRKDLASQHGVPPYVVFTDRSLHEMARAFPTTESGMLQVTGVGATRLARYGEQFMEAIRAFRQAHPELSRPGRAEPTGPGGR